MFALYKLQAKAWISNAYAWTNFITSLMFLAVIGSMMNPSGSADAASLVYLNVVGALMIFTSMNAAIQSFGFSFYQMKESVLLKRVGATKISKFGAISSFILWGFTTMLINILWMVFIVFMFTVFGHEGTMFFITTNSLNKINWLGVCVAIAVNAIAFYAVSLFFVSIAPNSEVYNIFATFYFFIIAFLGGGFAPAAKETHTWMKVISDLSPFGWTQTMMLHSIAGDSVFNFANGYAHIAVQNKIPTLVHITSTEAIMNLAMPLYGLLATGATVKFFSWDK
jgi:ABC-type multidrug transport system permease subunit